MMMSVTRLLFHWSKDNIIIIILELASVLALLQSSKNIYFWRIPFAWILQNCSAASVQIICNVLSLNIWGREIKGIWKYKNIRASENIKVFDNKYIKIWKYKIKRAFKNIPIAWSQKIFDVIKQMYEVYEFRVNLPYFFLFWQRFCSWHVYHWVNKQIFWCNLNPKFATNNLLNNLTLYCLTCHRGNV